MRTILMILLIIIAAGAGAGTGYLYGVDQGQAQAQTIRNEFFTARAGQTGAGAPTGAGAFNPSNQPGQGTQPGQVTQQGQGAQPRGANAQGLAQRRGVAGTIKSVQGNSFQVTAADGSTVTVNLDAQTTIEKLATAGATDLQAGQRVTVQTDQTGATVTARTIIVGLGQ